MRHVRLFISSPGDVAPERLQIERVAQRLSGEFAEALCFETFRWEENFYSVHDSVQAQIPEAAACDIVIAVFWKRLGTPLPDTFALAPDGRPYQSGSAYEVLSAIDARNAAGTDKPGVYVFQKTEPATFREDELEAGRSLAHG